MSEKSISDLLQFTNVISNNKNFSGELEQNVKKTTDNIQKIIKDSVAINDQYGNTLTSTGSSDKVETFTTYGFDNDTLNWTLWTALYNDSWVFKRAIDKPSQDCVRCGITLNGSQDKTRVYDVLSLFRNDLIQLLQWGSLYGGSVGVLMFDNFNDNDYSKSLDIQKLKSAKSMRMYVTDRWYGVGVINSDTVTDMNNIDFGKPKYYSITFADGHTITVHHDYVLRYEHRIAPKLIKTGQLQGWGYAEGAHIINELSRDDKLKSSIQSLINKSLIEVVKMSGMRGVFMGADSDNETQLRKRLEMVNWARNFNSLTLLDKDDDYSQAQFSGLAGLSDLLEKNMWLISAALEMQGVLFGDLKNGFSTDEDALERYDETILNRCESYYRPVLTKLILILYKKFDITDTVSYTFNSLQYKKHDKEKMEALKFYIDLLSQLLTDGIIDSQKYAKLLQQYSETGEVNFSFSDDELVKIKSDEESEMENIDLDNLTTNINKDKNKQK